MRTVSVRDARANFSDLLGMVYYTQQPVMVEKKGKAYAVVISPGQYENLKQAAKDHFFEIVNEIQTKNRNVNPKKVLRDVTKVVEEVRQQLYEKGE